ncbi:MAG: MFS transporter [Deinococcota bacterium]
MTFITRNPCDEGVIRGAGEGSPCEKTVKPWVLVATIAGSSMVFISGSTLGVALPSIQTALGASLVDAQWITNIYMLLLAALILLGGSLGDHYGRRRVFLIGVSVFTLASAGCGLATSTNMLIAFRALQGIGGALLTPGSLAIISATFPQEERGQAIGLWSGFSAMTSALGPILGGWLVDSLSWRWVFFLQVPLALVVIGVSLWRVPESRDDEVSGHIDILGAGLVTVGLGGLTYGFLEAGRQSLGSPAVLAALVVGVVCLVAFVVVEARVREPMVPLSIFASSNFTGANILTLLLYAGLGVVLFFFPFNLIQVQGYSATAAGAALLPFILMMSILSRWSGKLVDQVGARLPLTVGPALTGVGLLMFMIPGTSSNYWTGFFPAIVIMGLGMTVSVAPLTTTVMNAVPDHQAGTASGVNNAVSRLANLLAVALLGLVMLAVFGQQLGVNLAELNLSEDVVIRIMANRADLAALEPPANLTPNEQTQVTDAINQAFVAGFRAIIACGALLAFASSGVAAAMIGRREKVDV